MLLLLLLLLRLLLLLLLLLLLPLLLLPLTVCMLLNIMGRVSRAHPARGPAVAHATASQAPWHGRRPQKASGAQGGLAARASIPGRATSWAWGSAARAGYRPP